METAEFGTNTNPNTMNNIALLNSKIKKKPHNITIKNFNPNEPKIKSNMKYSDKQNYRRYKTKIEPKLHNKIMIDEEDDLVAKIRKEFGITDTDKKKNYSEVETSGADYVKPPEPREAEPVENPKYIYDISDISRDENEDIIGQLLDDMISRVEWLNDEEDTEGEEEDEDEETDEEGPAALRREKSGMTSKTELSALTTEAPDDIFDQAERYGITFRGPKPINPEKLKARERKIRKKIAEIDASRGMAKTEAKKGAAKK